MPSDSSAAFSGRSNPCCCISTSNHPLSKLTATRPPGNASSIGLVERVAVANLADRLKSRRQVRAVVAQDRRVRADLRQPRGRGRVRTEVIVEPPRPHLLPQHEHLRRVPRIRAVRHHAVEAGQAVRDDRPAVCLSTGFDERSPSIHEDRRRPERLAVPDTFPLDLRIVAERSARRGWKAEIDRVAEIVAGKTQAQADRVLTDDALNRAVRPGASRVKTSRALPTTSTAVRLPARAME